MASTEIVLVLTVQHFCILAKPHNLPWKPCAPESELFRYSSRFHIGSQHQSTAQPEWDHRKIRQIPVTLTALMKDLTALPSTIPLSASSGTWTHMSHTQTHVIKKSYNKIQFVETEGNFSPFSGKCFPILSFHLSFLWPQWTDDLKFSAPGYWQLL